MRKKIFCVMAMLVSMVAPASAAATDEDFDKFPVICTIVSSSDLKSDKVGDKIGIKYGSEDVYTMGDGGIAKRNKNFNTTFQNLPGKMKWTGYADTKYGIDKSVRLVAGWTHLARKNPKGGFISVYTETLYSGGKEKYKMVSECQQYE